VYGQTRRHKGSLPSPTVVVGRSPDGPPGRRDGGVRKVQWAKGKGNEYEAESGRRFGENGARRLGMPFSCLDPSRTWQSSRRASVGCCRSQSFPTILQHCCESSDPRGELADESGSEPPQLLGNRRRGPGVFFSPRRPPRPSGPAGRPNETLQIAGIGVGGKGGSDIDQAGKLGEVVALCDIDEGTLDGKAQKFSSAKKFHDFRKLYDVMARHIDAVTVSTPDHSHAPRRSDRHPAGQARLLPEPMAHSVFECRVLKEAARKYGVCTQMGNQGSAEKRPPQGGRAGAGRGHRRGQGGARLDQPADLAAGPQGDQSGPTRPTSGPPRSTGTSFLAGAPLRPFVKGFGDDFKGYLPPVQLARLARLRHRRHRRHGLPHGQHGLPRAEAGPPDHHFRREREVNSETYPGWAHVTLKFPARENLPPSP